jgi:hypothetical protein
VDQSNFDCLIARVDRWEQTRYPQRGRRMYVQARGIAAADSSTMYALHLEDVDGFMRRIWTVLEISPSEFNMAMRGGEIVVGISTYVDDHVKLMHA